MLKMQLSCMTLCSPWACTRFGGKDSKAKMNARTQLHALKNKMSNLKRDMTMEKPLFEDISPVKNGDCPLLW